MAHFQEFSRFNGHPPLGVNATGSLINKASPRRKSSPCFNGHPPLGVNATRAYRGFGYIYKSGCFNGHPPLGVNATGFMNYRHTDHIAACFNGHPPLGVNATRPAGLACAHRGLEMFQRAPTLGGECYVMLGGEHPLAAQVRSFNGHPPLGVNATPSPPSGVPSLLPLVSTGTHPWG